MSDHLVHALESQSRACASLGAPFSAGMLEQAARDVAAGGIVSRLLAGWHDVPTEKLVRDAVALRLLASLHYLILSGAAPELAVCYPPVTNDPERAWAKAESALREGSEQVGFILSHEPQTNEVRRSACLLGGFLTIGRETGLPLRCFELGASAGLNSLWDKFRYEIDGNGWGDAESSVILPSRWDGAAPSLDIGLTVAERYACDRRPVDIRQPADTIRLLSYCWAEQHERMARLQAAVALAKAFPVEVQAEPAVRWVRRAGPEAALRPSCFIRSSGNISHAGSRRTSLRPCRLMLLGRRMMHLSSGCGWNLTKSPGSSS